MSKILECIYQCEVCYKLDAAYLDCDHISCKECLITHTKEISLTQNPSGLFCPKCSKILIPSFTHTFIISPSELQHFLQSLKICQYCNQPTNDLIITKEKTLICYTCLSTYDEPKINSNPKKLENPQQKKIEENKLEAKPNKKEGILNPKKQLPLCSSCKSAESEETGCKHLYCLKCINKIARKSLARDPYVGVSCDKCKNVFNDLVVEKSFGSKIFFEKFKIECANALFFVPTFDCGICMNKTQVESGITFNCDHRFCVECAKEYFKERIMSSNVAENEFVCPNCNEAIDHNIIQGVVERDLYEKYVNFAFKNWKPEDGNILKYCHFCEAGAEIPRDLKKFTCPQCKKSYCPQCNQDHSTKQTCDEYIQNKEKKAEDKKQAKRAKKIEKNIKPAEIVNKAEILNKLNAKKNPEDQKKPNEKKPKKVENDNYLENLKKDSKPCPKCKNFVYRDSGCNFIKCRWPGCKDSYFCYLCGIALTVHHHYSHYKTSGPFGKTCNKLDGINDDKH